MNVLFEKFPETVTVEGKKYRVVTDFREWIKLHEFLENMQKYTRYTLEIILDWYMDTRPDDEVLAVRALQDFMAAGELHPENNGVEEDSCTERETPPEKPSFSFSQDAVCIYSAFRAVYGIDITNIPYMHWYQFLALFEGLPENTEIKQRMYYRSVDLNSVEGKEERKRIKKLKKQLALKTHHKRKMDAYEIGDVFS